jgi:hypothetical protein
MSSIDIKNDPRLYVDGSCGGFGEYFELTTYYKESPLTCMRSDKSGMLTVRPCECFEFAGMKFKVAMGDTKSCSSYSEITYSSSSDVDGGAVAGIIIAICCCIVVAFVYKKCKEGEGEGEHDEEEAKSEKASEKSDRKPEPAQT